MTPPSPGQIPPASGDDTAAAARIQAERDTLRAQVAELKGKLDDAKTLQDIEDAKQTIAAEYDARLLSVAIDTELIKAGCIDTIAAKAHIDTAKMKLSGDRVEGLDISGLVKSLPYLFGAVQKVSTGAPPQGVPSADDALVAKARRAAGLKDKD